MAKYDGSIRINTNITTKNIKPKVKEISKSLMEIGKDAEKAKEKLYFMDKSGVSHSSDQYKQAKRDLQQYVDAYRKGMQKIVDYEYQARDILQFDTSKIYDAKKIFSL